MTQLHFIRFTEAASAYSLILAIIEEEIETLPTALQRYDFTYKSIFTISQTLKYHKVNEDTCPRPLFLPMRLQALTSEDDNYDYATPALQSKSTASSISEDVENSVSENVPTDELDHEWMEVLFIETDPEILKATSSNTSQNQSSHALPEVPLDRSVLENISSPPNLQLSDCHHSFTCHMSHVT